uniref:N/A n=1 Tax=Ganoderma boninense TaxID=34458 RepID=A0A5K1JT80_9APHY|nr:N/A [Ganoderma boninense]
MSLNSPDVTHPASAETSATLLYALGLSLSLLAFLYLRSFAAWRARSRGLSTPPGPPPLPFFGNALDMPKTRQWEGFRDLCAKYGNILCMHVFTQPVVVLGSADVISEYLDKRSANTSDRKQTASLQLIGYDTAFGLMSYGLEWKLRRRMFWQHFNPTVITNYHTIQRETARTLLRTLLTQSYDAEKHLTECAATTLLRVLYGLEKQHEIDEAIAAIQGGLEGARNVLVSGASSWISFLFYDTCHHSYRSRDGTAGRCDDAPPSVVGDVIANLLQDGQDTEHVANVEFIAKRIAVDSMQDIQKKAQVELDAVVGPDRLPDFSDRESLVYIDAIIKEALRWMPPAPFGITHCTRDDDELRGYFIPAGTVLIANIWACLHDPEAYENPEEFRPERYLHNGKPDPSARDPNDFVFGFGRRCVCVPVHI